MVQPRWEAGLLSVSWFKTGVELLQGGGWGKGEGPTARQELVEGTGDVEMGEVKCGLPWRSLGPLKLRTLGTGLESETRWPEKGWSPGLVREEAGEVTRLGEGPWLYRLTTGFGPWVFCDLSGNSRQVVPLV